MSRYQNKQSISIRDIIHAKSGGRKLSCVTCYDSAFGRLIDRTSIDLVLVGDSLGNVVLGYDSTIPVTIDQMVHHSAAVARVITRPLLCTDMPFMSYHLSVPQALKNAARLVQEGGAHCVKLEGGESIVPQVRHLVEAGIPVMGHLGLTPQSVHQMGGYRVQGKGPDAARQLKNDAKALEAAGAFAIVLEMVPRELAAEVTQSLHIPTIGIGAGPECDGQILVLHDLLGFEAGFKPKFLKKYADMSSLVTKALEDYVGEVRASQFPMNEHSFSDAQK